MIELRTGDILKADAEALVNTVNCVGVAGRGIALQFRKAFPDNYQAYREACDRHELQPGTLLVHDRQRLHNPRYIINFPTKRHWKGRSRLEDIRSGLPTLIETVRTRGIRSVAVPPLGCGLGGLAWGEVRPLIEAAFRELPEVQVLLFEPSGAPAAAEMAKLSERPKMTTGRAALLGLMRRYLAGVMDPFVSLLEVHKLLYFMQEAGEELRLRYAKAHYGPYAENLRHVLGRLEGHYIEGYGDAADRPSTPIELLPGAAEEAERFLAEHPATQGRFERVAELIAGFESAFGLELLATVHWTARREGASSAEEAAARTYAWNQRKQMFDEGQISVAWGVLEAQGWLERAGSPGS